MFSARPNVLDGFLQAAYFADLQNEIGAFGLRPEVYILLSFLIINPGIL